VAGRRDGVAILVLVLPLAPFAASLMGGEGRVGDDAAMYLRIAAIGAPVFMLAAAGQGYLRGISDLRTPLLILIAAHVVNVVLELLFRLRLRLGPGGLRMGDGDRAGRDGGGVRRRPAARGLAGAAVGAHPAADPDRHAHRGAHDRAARLVPGSPPPCSPRVVLGLARRPPGRVPAVGVLALVLDALAIAAQVMVGRMLGAGDAAAARAASVRMILWSTVVGLFFGVILLALVDVLPRAFTDDPAVIDRAQCAVAAVRGDDAGGGGGVRARRDPDRRGRHPLPDVGMLASAAVYVPIAQLALAEDWGIVGVWAGLVGPDPDAAGHLRRALRRQPLGAHRRAARRSTLRASCVPPRHPHPRSSSCSRRRRARPGRHPFDASCRPRSHAARRPRSRATPVRRRLGAPTLYSSAAALVVALLHRRLDRARRPPTCRTTSATSSRARQQPRRHKHERQAQGEGARQGPRPAQARKAHRKKAER
jgi:hypothetical protein